MPGAFGKLTLSATASPVRLSEGSLTIVKRISTRADWVGGSPPGRLLRSKGKLATLNTGHLPQSLAKPPESLLHVAPIMGL